MKPTILEELKGYVTYIDEQGNAGECSLQEMNDAQYFYDSDVDAKDCTIDEAEMESMRLMKAGETVRLNGWMGMYTDVTRIR